VSVTAILLGIFTVVGMSTGQILFKLAAGQGRIDQILLSPYLWIATCLYGVVTLAWVLLLREIDLARAYPLLAACYVLVPIAAALILGERFGPLYGLGVVLILVGIFLTLRS
jgi:drug/metabolite transporter (DMT)-like permease